MTTTTKKVFRRCALAALLVFVTLIGILFFIRQRTIGEWRDFKAHWEAQGEHFDVEHFIPEPIPDEENLAMHPFINGLLMEDGGIAPGIEALQVEAIEGYPRDATTPDRRRRRASDFSTWTGLAPGLSPDERVSEILVRMEPMHPDLDRVAQAVRERPRCQFPMNREFVLATETNQIFDVLQLVKTFQLRASLRLQAGDPQLAVDDLITIRRLSSIAEQEDSLVSLLIEVAILHTFLDGVWDGITRQVLDDADLIRLASRFPGGGDVGRRCLDALRFERAALLQVIDLMQDDPGKLSPGALPARNGFVSLWWANNRLAASEDLQEHLLSPGGTAATRPTLAGATRLDAAIQDRADGLSRYTQAIAIMAAPVSGAAVARVLQIEAEIDNARVAIAVERYRLKHGAYPADLAALLPEFLPALPVDEINHRPIEYRLRPDGTPLIYQWGGDGDDDGGTPRKSLRHGDVVWQYPLDPPIDRREYERED